jgi:hypothetical protein
MDITKYYEAVATSHETLAGFFIKALSQGLEGSAEGAITDRHWEVFWEGIITTIIDFSEQRLHEMNPGYQRHALMTTMAILPDLMKSMDLEAAMKAADDLAKASVEGTA